MNRDGGESVFAAIRSLQGQEEVNLSLLVVDNDSDPDGDSISVQFTSNGPNCHCSLAVNPDGTVQYTSNAGPAQFSSPAELGAVMAKSAQCQECIVKQYFRYTAGRLETPADRPAIQKILNDFRDSQFHFKDLIVSVMRLREFPNSERAVHVASDHKPR